jgi:hypothetical protein
MAGNPFAASTSSSSSAPRENVYYLGGGGRVRGALLLAEVSATKQKFLFSFF